MTHLCPVFGFLRAESLLLLFLLLSFLPGAQFRSFSLPEGDFLRRERERRKKSAYRGSDGERALNYAKSCFYGILYSIRCTYSVRRSPPGSIEIVSKTKEGGREIGGMAQVLVFILFSAGRELSSWQGVRVCGLPFGVCERTLPSLARSSSYSHWRRRYRYSGWLAGWLVHASHHSTCSLENRRRRRWSHQGQQITMAATYVNCMHTYVVSCSQGSKTLPPLFPSI